MKNIRIVVALRGLAALAVAVFHIVNAPIDFVKDTDVRSFFVKGTSGVQMFFIISGLVIPLSLIRMKFKISRFGRFMLKRTIRIEPTYLAVITFSFVFVGVRQFLLNDGGLLFPSMLDVFLNITYLVPFFEADWINPVFWTLGVELQYYLLIALMWPLAKKLNHPVWVFLLPVLGLLGSNYTGGDFMTHWLQFFNIGIILALHLTNRIGNKIFWVAELICLGCILLHWNLFYASLAACTLGAIVLFPQKSGGKILQFIGEQSYSLYLIHGFVGCTTVNLAMRFLILNHVWQKIAVVIIALLVSLAAAQVLYLLVEQPTMKKSKRINLH